MHLYSRLLCGGLQRVGVRVRDTARRKKRMKVGEGKSRGETERERVMYTNKSRGIWTAL